LITKYFSGFSMSAGYNVTFLENKVLEVNGTGFIEGEFWCWSTCHQEWK
jgi:hypothetical protein